MKKVIWSYKLPQAFKALLRLRYISGGCEHAAYN
jgi:hypothetical protein